MAKARVTIDHIENEGVADATMRVLEHLRWTEIVPVECRAVSKSNSTYPYHRPGVTTGPAATEALIARLSERAGRVPVTMYSEARSGPRYANQEGGSGVAGVSHGRS